MYTKIGIPENNSLKSKIEELYEWCDKRDNDDELGKTYFNEPIDEDKLNKWEEANGVKIPETYKEWLRFTEKCLIDGSSAMFWGTDDFHHNFMPDNLTVIGEMSGDGEVVLALSPDGSTLYVSDLGSRCIWAVDAAARELTAGGRGCTAAFAGLPGYPGALAADTDGTLYISYRWARSSWLEKNADSTLLRGIALRAGQNTQERLFRCTADAPCDEAVSLATGAWEQTFTGLAQDSCAAVCPVESKVYFGAAGADSLLAANR